jgi:hypothetical protein
MKNDKIDLSPLDPSRDQRKWNDLVNNIVKHAIEARERRDSVTHQQPPPMFNPMMPSVTKRLT